MSTAEEISRATLELFAPPTRRNLSEWSDEFYYLSEESSSTPGPWTTLPYQVGVMNAITDPDVRMVVWKKCARVGATKILCAAIGYYMDQDPCPIMVVQPTVEDGKGFSKEEIAPMLRDCKRLARLVPEPTAKSSGNTLLHKVFAGGSISVVGANSGRGFRRVSRKFVACDEADGYPLSAGTEGDPIKLAMQRSFYYWDRKTYVVSTPGLEGQSRIDAMYLAGDQRKFYVPCPHCGAFDFLAFKESSKGGHFMKWPKGKPELAYFVCSRGGCVIEHKDKFKIIAAGEWRAAKKFKGTASFHIWAAYSHSPNASWGNLASEWVAAEKAGPDELKVFVNTALGETWREQGEAPAWERLYQRRESYLIGTVPEGVVFLTAGVDVQRDRLVYEIVGWGAGRQSWSVDAGVLPGDTSAAAVWKSLDELLSNTWKGARGIQFGIQMLAIDSGYNTQVVYNWAKRYPLSRVIACKGVATSAVLVSSPTSVWLKTNGKKVKRGAKVWPIGVNIAKAELYGYLRQELPTGDPGKDAKGNLLPVEIPPGYCHFPAYGEDFFQQLTAEQLVRTTNRRGFVALEWQLIPGRENHFLDCRILARAAASKCGLDMIKDGALARARPKTSAPPVAEVLEPSPAAAPSESRPPATEPKRVEVLEGPSSANPGRAKSGSWLSNGRGFGLRGSWLGRKR